MDLVWVHRSEVLAWFSGEMEWGSWKSFSELHQKGKRETKGEKERERTMATRLKSGTSVFWEYRDMKQYL